MNKNKFSLFFLLLTLVMILTGCSSVKKTEVEEVIAMELDQLKNLDSATTKQYISSENMFPDATESQSDSQLVEEFVSLFFQDFDYKIMDIDVKKDSATATVRLMTLDSQTLAHDFASAYLQEQILAAANSSQVQPLLETSLDAHYELLNKLIQEKTYDLVETSCIMNLKHNDDVWVIQATDELENQLVGGFISYIANSELLTPQETVEIYFSTFKEMDTQQMTNFLGVSTLLNTEDAGSDSLTAALLEQVHGTFDYKIKDTAREGYNATVDTDIITFDYDSIMNIYEKSAEEYLETPQALYDGAEGRLSKSQELLLTAVTDNTATAIIPCPVELINDGISWKLKTTDAIGNAIFGGFTSGVDYEEDEDSDTDSAEYSEDAADSDMDSDMDSDS